jgi:hypothetical protein
VVCECGFCTFPDKNRAADEFTRLLRPGGRLGLTDVTVAGPLPSELHGLAAWVACIVDARGLEEYAALLDSAGLRVTHRESHGAAIGRMLDEIEARLSLLAITHSAAHLDVDLVTQYLDLWPAGSDRGDTRPTLRCDTQVGLTDRTLSAGLRGRTVSVRRRYFRPAPRCSALTNTTAIVDLDNRIVAGSRAVILLALSWSVGTAVLAGVETCCSLERPAERCRVVVAGAAADRVDGVARVRRSARRGTARG